MADIDSEDGAGAADAAGSPVAVPSGRWAGRGRNLLIAAGAAAVLIGGAVVVSQDEPATTSATTGTTAVPRGPDRSPSTTRSTLAAPTTAAYIELAPKGQLLAEPSGLILYGVTSDGQLARVDLDTGVVGLRRLPGPAEQVAQLVPRQGAIVVVAYPPSPAFVVALDLEREPVSLEVNAHQLHPAMAPDELWRVVEVFGVDGESPTAQRIHLDGTPAGPELRLPLHVFNVDGAGRLLGSTANGSVYAFEPDGTPLLLSERLPAALDAHRIVDVYCDERLVCRWRVRERDTAEERVLEPPIPPELLLNSVSGVLSPDGRWLALTDLPDLHVVDLSTGLVRLVGSSSQSFGGAPVVWAPDGRWLFWSQNGTVWFWRAGTDATGRVGEGSLPALSHPIAVARGAR